MAGKIDTLSKSIVFLIIFAGLVFLTARLKSEDRMEDYKPLLPAQIGEWSLSAEIPIKDEFLQILGTKSAVLAEYSNNENDKFQIYVLKSSKKRSSFHQPEYCYLGSGKNELMKRGMLNIDLEGEKSTKINYFLAQTGKGTQVVCYFYTVNNMITASYYKQQFYYLLNRLKNKRVDGSLVRISKYSLEGNFDDEIKKLQLIVKSVVKLAF